MQIEPVQGFCPAQRVDRELRQLIVAQVQGPQGRSNGPVKEYLCYFIFKIYVSMYVYSVSTKPRLHSEQLYCVRVWLMSL